MIGIVKDYFAYFLEEIKYFYSNIITSSADYNYSIIERGMQANTDCLKSIYVLLNHQLILDEKMKLKYFSVGPSQSFP